jgi:hypothetical protein
MENNLTCNKCGTKFNRKFEYDRHLNRLTDCVTGEKRKKPSNKYICKNCKKSYSRAAAKA